MIENWCLRSQKYLNRLDIRFYIYCMVSESSLCHNWSLFVQTGTWSAKWTSERFLCVSQRDVAVFLSSQDYWLNFFGTIFLAAFQEGSFLLFFLFAYKWQVLPLICAFDNRLSWNWISRKRSSEFLRIWRNKMGLEDWIGVERSEELLIEGISVHEIKYKF